MNILLLYFEIDKYYRIPIGNKIIDRSQKTINED